MWNHFSDIISFRVIVEFCNWFVVILFTGCKLPLVSDWLSSYCRIFRDVPSDITIDVNGGTFALHKVSYFTVIYSEFVQQVMYIVMNLASCSAWNFSSFFFFSK